ncbi:MAG: hypothetical protein L3J88_09325 [Gammaproteobacteria bacterium]|nr:hypothetical protein [Gammaproteobacteria bacterium]MCF6363523.1 hypothetical protein [Gammaproteobacteria bacterium]
MSSPRLFIVLLPLLFLLGFSSPALAGACSYREAIMALQQGNPVRGMALLRMARRDGDLRASLYLAALQADDDKRFRQASVPLAVIAKSMQ